MPVFLIAALLLGGPVVAAGQAELDRILVHVNDSIITTSDVRQAKLLRLVPDPSSDATTQRGLEDRLLMLLEVGRAPATDPLTDAELAAHRKEWESAVGPTNVAGLLSQAGMSDVALQAWLRDDLRIRAYVTRLFGALPDADRPRATADWVERLRQRAGLK